MLTFISGQTVGAQRCTDVSVLDDNLIEEDEIFILSLVASPHDENAVMFVAGENYTTITILQDPNDSKSFYQWSSYANMTDADTISNRSSDNII